MNLDRSGPWIAVVGIVVNVWLTASSLRYAPWPVMVLLAIYLMIQVALVKKWAPLYPRRCVIVPIIGAVCWAVTVINAALLFK